MGIHGYFSIYGNVSLEPNQENICKYYLTTNNCSEDFLNKKYKLVPIQTEKYKLYMENNE